MGNVQMEADQIRFKNASYGNVQTALTAALSGGSGSSTLADLTDTDISTPTNGQVLTYDSTAEKWENANIPTPATPSLSDLTDTTISTPTNGQVLTYDSTAAKWVNANASGGGGGINLSTTPTVIGQYAGSDLYAKLVAIGDTIANSGTLDLDLPENAVLRKVSGYCVESGSFKNIPHVTNISTPGNIGFDISGDTLTWRTPATHTLTDGYMTVCYTIASQSK